MRYTLLLFSLLLAVNLEAQDVTVLVNSPKVVNMGEAFQVDVIVNAKPSNIKLDMNTFTIARGPFTSQSTSVSILNGKMQQSAETTYTYMMQPSQVGTHTIDGGIIATVGGKEYKAPPFVIEVAGSGQQPAQTQAGQGQAQTQPGNEQVAPGDDVFIRILVDKTKVYQGEYITASLKLYSKVNISSLGDLENPIFEGFFKQEVETPPLRSLERETINGQAYGTGVLKRYILFPQKSGELTISPSKLVAGIEQQAKGRSRFDDIFGFTQTVPRDLKSLPVKITVMPLPTGQPASFTGAVGQFNSKVSINKQDVKANDPVTLTVTVSGSGNVKFIDAPRINFPPDFETYDPKVNLNLNATATSGSKTFEYLLIPRHGGTYKIPPVEFSYFDLPAKQFKSQRSDELVITVEMGEEQPGSTVVSGVTREDVKFLGKDIRFIKSEKYRLTRQGKYFFGSWTFFLWYLVSAILFFVIVFQRRQYIRKYSDVATLKNKKANRYATKRLKQARLFMVKGQQEQFYEELSRALWGYLGDKLSIVAAKLSKERATGTLEQRQVDPAITQELMNVIDTCEYARYAPSVAGSNMESLYERAVEVIDKLQKAIK